MTSMHPNATHKGGGHDSPESRKIGLVDLMEFLDDLYGITDSVSGSRGSWLLRAGRAAGPTCT